MTTQDFINNSKENGNYFLFQYHENSPFTEIADIIEIREKAIKFSIEYINKPVWMPISALAINKTKDGLTVKTWFKKTLNDPSKNYQCKALGVLK